MIDSKDLKKSVDKMLKEEGFTRKGASWYLHGEEIVAVFNIQKSNYDNSSYMNIGFFLRDLEKSEFPKDYEAHVRSRAEDIWQEGNPNLSELLNEEYYYPDDEERINIIRTIVKEYVVPLLKKGLTKNGLSEVIRTGNFQVRRVVQDIL